MDQALYQQIVTEYRKNGSVDITAKNCGTYPIKVRKVLITEGLWHSRKSDAVNALRKRGYSVTEIAAELGMDEKNVQYYLPYTEKTLAGEKTESGKRVQSFRERNRNAADGSRIRKKEKKNISEQQDWDFADQGILARAELREPTEPAEYLKREISCFPLRKAWTGYLLHAEMVYPKYDPDEDCEDIFEGEKDQDVLRALLKTKGGISRDLIVPGNMSLHQLSYALQKAFGFQNSHLHHFSLPKRLLRQLTGDRTGNWVEMCGIYLHAPVAEDFNDLYWDDDYREGKSPNVWMKSKYTGDPADYAVGETYIDTLRLMDEEKEWVQEQMEREKDSSYPGYEELPLDVHEHEYYPEGNLNRVLERLKIGEIMGTESIREAETEAWQEKLREKNRTARNYLEACRGTYAFQSLTEGLDTLRELRTERDRLEHVMWMRRNGIREDAGGRPEELLEEVDRGIMELEHQLGNAMHAFDPPAEPITDTFYYHYDYGDDWLIRITCDAIYTRWDEIQEIDTKPEIIFEKAVKNNGLQNTEMEAKIRSFVLQRDFCNEYDYMDTEGNRTDDTVRSALIHAELKKAPVCIAAEGLPPVEDVGGIGGFFDFLRTIHGEDAEEAARMRKWARGNGWKEVVPKAEGLV